MCKVSKITKERQYPYQMSGYGHKPTVEDLQNEYAYDWSIKVLKKMVAADLLTPEEYNRVDTLLINQYKPMYYKLFPNYHSE